MDELAITEVPEPNSLGGSVFLFQQVAAVREGILKSCGRDFDSVARRQLDEIFTMTDRTDKDLVAMADLYSDELSPQDA
jgi:hypothetical protein